MATGYTVYCPSTSFNTYSGNWMGNITTWAYEFQDHVEVAIKFYTTQKYVNSKVQGTDYFYGTVVVNGQSESFRIAYLGYPGYNSSYIFTKEYSIPFNSSGKANLTVSASVKGAAGTYLSGYTLSGSLSHTFSNAAKAGTLELSPSAKKMGDTATLAVKGGEGTIRYRITYAFGSLTGLVDEEQMIAEDAALYETKWVIPDLLDGCPDAVSGLLTLTCETYRFDTLIGTSQVQREISVFPAATLKIYNMRIGTSEEINVTRASERYTTTLRYRLLGQEGIIAENFQGDVYTWEIPQSFGKLMPSTFKETLYVFCDSYHGTALVGTESETCIISVDPNSRPVIDSVKTRVYIPGAPEEFQGRMLQNISLVDYTVEAHSDTSEIASYTFKGFGKEITIPAEEFQGFLAVPANSFAGKHNFEIKATDKRDKTVTNYRVWTVRPYTKPKVIPYSAEGVNYAAPMCFRSDKEGMASGSGTFVRILAGKMYSDVIINEVKLNAGKMEYRIRRSGEPWPETFTELISFEAEEDFVSCNEANAFPDPDASYEIELKVTDRVGFSHSYFAKVSSQKVNFSLLCAADGAAFGKTAEYPGVVEIAQDMTLWVRGQMKVDGAEWNSLEAVENTEIWESGYAHGHKVVSGCYYRTEQGSKVTVAFNRAIKWGGTQITVNAVPIPLEDCPSAPVSAVCPAEDGFILATVGTDGYITIDLAWSAKSATQYNWTDGFIEYWKEET